MSILIKGMEMPKSCDNCWALDDHSDHPRCRITEERRGYDFSTRENRMDKCPLVPIPPRGQKNGAVEMKNNIDDDYKRGAEDAWEAARKIVLMQSDGGLSLCELHNIFGFSGFHTILKAIPSLEAIEKIREHEERNEFQVGDEVTNEFGFYAVVVRTDVNNDKSKMHVVFRDGSSGEQDKECWTKTGRHFPQISEVLSAMY